MSDTQDRGSDLLELLAADHHRLRHLVLEDTDTAVLVRELATHLVADAHLLYAEARRSVANADPLVDDLADVDHLLEEALVDLDKHAGDPDVRKRVRELAARHIDHQEDGLFPRMRDEVDRRRLVALGDALGEVLAQAPTHAHPNLPAEGPLAIIADALAARYDELRDAYREGRRGKEADT
jgi:hypothetical protein